MNTHQRIDETEAQRIVAAVVALTDKTDDRAIIDELAKLTEALHTFARHTDGYATMETSLYSLDEYVSLKYAQIHGESINEVYFSQLRDELLERRI